MPPDRMNVQCPHSGHAGSVPTAARGNEIGCPKCQRRFAAIPSRVANMAASEVWVRAALSYLGGEENEREFGYALVL
jgi:hypothetical protein